MKAHFHWKLGSVQSKAVSLIILASTVLAPAQTAFAAFGDGSPTVPNISLFTAQTEDAKIDGSTGAFTQRITLDIPPGRNGLQPDISLQYNSCAAGRRRTRMSTRNVRNPLPPQTERVTQSENIRRRIGYFRILLPPKRFANFRPTVSDCEKTVLFRLSLR